MAQIKIYGLAAHLKPIRSELSDTIHSCVVDALRFPKDKRAQRFFHLDPEDFYMPAGRTQAYTIIEISLIEGRSVSAKKRLVRLLFDRILERHGIAHHDLEINLQESPACNWGFRGQHGDEILLNYKIDV